MTQHFAPGGGLKQIKPPALKVLKILSGGGGFHHYGFDTVLWPGIWFGEVPTRGISKSLVSFGQILLTDLVGEKEGNTTVQDDELNPCSLFRLHRKD